MSDKRITNIYEDLLPDDEPVIEVLYDGEFVPIEEISVELESTRQELEREVAARYNRSVTMLLQGLEDEPW